MKNYFLLILMTLFTSINLQAQAHLPGLWKGFMTKGGLFSEEGYTFELFLEVDGSYLKGRSYVHLNDSEVVEMEVKGRINKDRSLNLYDIEFIYPADGSIPPEFKRKYQLIYKRSAWESETSLNGFWQQIIDSPFNEQRKRGRIFLKKVTNSKA